MKQVLLNMLLTLDAIKEDKISHIPVSDQNSQTFFPPSLPATEIQVMIVKDCMKTPYFIFMFYYLLQTSGKISKLDADESSKFRVSKSDNMPFGFWYNKESNLHFNPFKKLSSPAPKPSIKSKGPIWTWGGLYNIMQWVKIIKTKCLKRIL